MSEKYKITDKGLDLAVGILMRDGYLPLLDAGVPPAMQLKTACRRYIEASKAKGDARSDQECQDAILIAFFGAYLEDVTRKLN